MRIFFQFLIAACTLAAADFSGIWVGQIPTGRDGELRDVAFQFIQEGNKLTGKLYGDYSSMAISESTLYGDLLTFVVVAPEQAGNQINQTRLRFSGKLIDGTLELTRDRERSTNAGNGGGVQTRDNVKQTFRVKRLL
ncbi:MAG: hypothetical protein JJE04_20300 [Acidobacteriia bacterium]|nr:hypothetical protein [Terriglobia bacterium]